MASDWFEDCMQFHGVVLTGRFAHWCPDWDDLPVDETVEEFKVCHCFEAEASNEGDPKMSVESGSGADSLGAREVMREVVVDPYEVLSGCLSLTREQWRALVCHVENDVAFAEVGLAPQIGAAAMKQISENAAAIVKAAESVLKAYAPKTPQPADVAQKHQNSDTSCGPVAGEPT